MRQGVKTELKEGKLCGMEDRGRGTLWKGMKKQTRSKQMRSESPEKLPALTGGSEALEMGRKLPTSNPPNQVKRATFIGGHLWRSNLHVSKKL